MISIVVVNWNSGHLLKNCVASLLANAYNCELVIVDNASDDFSLEAAARLSTDLSILKNDRNLGFAAAANQGWRASRGSHILFLNPDVVCLPGSVECLEKTLAADESVWAVAGHLVDPSGRPQRYFNVRSFPSTAGVAAEMLFLTGLRSLLSLDRFLAKKAPAHALDVDQPAAACLMIKRAALETTGGFDESFLPAWYEDVDLCRRIRDRGGRIQYQPAARFIHHGGYSLGRLSRESFLVTFNRNRIRYFHKHHGPKTAARIRLLITVGLWLRSTLSLLYPLIPGESRRSAAKIFRNAERSVRKQREVRL